jgi:hypothetical protein
MARIARLITATVPEPFGEAVDTVANRRLMNIATLIGQLLATMLRDEGFDVAELCGEKPRRRKHGEMEVRS